jgi:orotidine-5'-phosphate decarboxylase
MRRTTASGLLFISHVKEDCKMEVPYPIIPDVDKMSLRQALNLVHGLYQKVQTFKVHSVAEEELRSTIRAFKDEGAQGVFVDYKLHDMRDTVKGRAARIKDAGATMLTVHAEGRPEMIAAAVENGPEIILAVTKLTSWSDTDIEAFYRRSAQEVFTELALWAVEGGAQGIVCPASHVGHLHKNPKLRRLIKVVPGTRSIGVAANDQKQVDTPYNAMFNGATYLVGGRQITQAENPCGALLAMANEMRLGLEARAKLQDDIITETM